MGAHFGVARVDVVTLPAWSNGESCEILSQIFHNDRAFLCSFMLCADLKGKLLKIQNSRPRLLEGWIRLEGCIYPLDKSLSSEQVLTKQITLSAG